MAKTLTKSNFSYIKPIYILANFLAISPPYYFHEQKKTKILTSFKIWASLMWLGIIFTYVYCMEGASRVFFNQAKITTTFIHIVFLSFVTVSNAISVFGAAYHNAKAWKTMIDTLQYVDNRLPGLKLKKKSVTGFYAIVVMGHFFFLLVLSYDAYVGQKINGMAVYQFQFILRLQYYFIFLLVILICNFALCIRNSFTCFNKQLRKLTQVPNKAVYYVGPWTFGKRMAIDDITQVYTTLGDLVEVYNQIFGWQVFILMGIILMALLESFNFIMVFEISKHEKSSSESFAQIPVTVLSTLEFLVWGVSVIMCCDKANREIQRSAKISFQILPNIADSTPEFRKILFLAQQAASRCPQLSAANVFDVNISTLFALFGSITTYVVVVIQFNTI